DGFGLVVIDLDEHDVLLEAHGIIAPAVEAFAGDSAEVAHPRQRHGDQTIEKFVHAVLAQGNLHADGTAGGDLERCDGLLRPGDHRLLAGNRGEVVLRALNLLLVGRAFAGADIEYDLFDPRRLELVLVGEFLHQLRTYDIE